MASVSDYAVVRESNGNFRLDRITESYPGKVAFIVAVMGRSGQPVGWRLKPLVTMLGSKRKIWDAAAAAIALTKLMTSAQAKRGVAEATRSQTRENVGGAP